MEKLILHAGGVQINRNELATLKTPAPTRSHFPVPHGLFVNTVAAALENSGARIDSEEHGIAKEGNRYFGLFNLKLDRSSDDYGFTVGLRNSHDKSFVMGLCAGSRVFICDNLAFSNEITVARKHTRHIRRDLQPLVWNAIGRLGEARIAQDNRIAAYRNFTLDDAGVHDLLIRSVDARVIPNAKVPHVLRQWRKPEHEQFQPRTAWSLFNGYTEILKSCPVAELPARTVRLHGMLDTVCGVN